MMEMIGYHKEQKRKKKAKMKKKMKVTMRIMLYKMEETWKEKLKISIWMQTLTLTETTRQREGEPKNMARVWPKNCPCLIQLQKLLMNILLSTWTIESLSYPFHTEM